MMYASNEYCRACDARTRWSKQLPHATVFYCDACGSVTAIHDPQYTTAALTWEEADITPTFLEALAARRSLQANEIARRLASSLAEPVLDYACGQGLFAADLRDRNLDVWAADLSLPEGSRAAEAGKFLRIDAPWHIPENPSGKAWGTIALLDVLEHHPAPRDFLQALPADRVLIKVPNARGPLALVAAGAATIGWPSALERMLLVGDAAPHQTFFTRTGLLSALRGFSIVAEVPLADVGREFPERYYGHRVSAVRALPFRVAGIILEHAARAWSDTIVVLAERSSFAVRSVTDRSSS